MGEIYDPIGTFRYKEGKRKLKINLGIYFPILKDNKGLPRKIKLKEPEIFTVKSEVLPAVLMVINPKKLGYRDDTEENIEEDLRQLEGNDLMQRKVNAEEKELIEDGKEEPIEDIEPYSCSIKKGKLSDKPEIRHIAVIVFHSNHKFENIKKCFKDFWKLQTRELEKSPEKIFDVDLGFARYYKDNCEKTKKSAPETSGGSILVGV